MEFLELMTGLFFNDMLKNFIIVGCGGAIGAMIRYGVTLLFIVLNCSNNIATLCVNVIGSFCMGVIMKCVDATPWTLFLMIGICGGFTTFSTFSVQSVSLIQEGKHMTAVAYVFSMVILCVAFAAIGFIVGQRIRH